MFRRNFFKVIALALLAPFLPAVKEAKRFGIKGIVKVPYAISGDRLGIKETVIVSFKYDEYILGDGSVVTISKDNNTLSVKNAEGDFTIYTIHNKKWETHIGNHPDKYYESALEYYEGPITDDEMQLHRFIEMNKEMMVNHSDYCFTKFGKDEKALGIYYDGAKASKEIKLIINSKNQVCNKETVELIFKEYNGLI